MFGEDERRAYAILNIPPTATRDEVREVYLDLVRRWHPDQYQNDVASQQEAVRRMAMINWAYNALSNRLADATNAVADVPIVEPPREIIASGLARKQIDDIAKAINYERSLAREWSDPWNRAALWIALIWVSLVAVFSWFAPKTGLDPVVGRALAPVGALSIMAICIGMIWFGNGVYRVLGWAFLAFFVLLLPVFRAIMWAHLR